MNIIVMKSIRLFAVSLLCVLSLPLYAADSDVFTAKTVEGIDMTFKVINAADKTCQVGEGVYKKPAIDQTTNGAITIPSNANGYTVTSIGKYAFQDCSGLTSINIPNSVTSIGNDAFQDCSGLTSINIPNSVTSIGIYAFQDCSGLTSITIPNSVTSIESHAFQYCSGLTSINIPNSVTSIGDHAFDSFSGLTRINIPNSVTSIGEWAFERCSGLTRINIPNSVTSIGDDAFHCCSSLTSITVDSENKVYDSRDNCNAIIESTTNTLITGCKNTIIPNSVTSIKEAAFWGCSGLKSITIPNSVTSIGHDAFGACSGLTSITIPNSVTSIGGAAFSGCSGLTSITVDIENMVYDSRDNCNAIIESATNTLITGCKNTIIPNSVTSIGGSAFNGCSSLTSIDIPNSVTSIGGSAFDGCSSLTSINIPNSVTSIGKYAFFSCEGLTSITIPSSVTNIGGYAFSSCRGLTSIVSYIAEPFTITDNVFESSIKTSAILYVPYGTKSLYEQTDGWKEFVNIVENANDDDKYYLYGGINNWKDSDKTCMLYGLNGNKFSYTTEWSSEYNFYIWDTGAIGDMSKCWGVVDNSMSGTLTNGESPISAPLEGFYTFTIDMNNHTYEWTAATPQEEYESISIIGSFSDWIWSEDVDLKQVSPHNWYVKYTINENAELKFRANHNWDYNWGCEWNVSDCYYGHGIQSGKNIKVPAGTYDFYLNDVTGHINIVETSYEDGDVFTAKTIEGIDMTFRIISEANKTCQVGENAYASTSHQPAIDKTTNGAITIPSNANGYSVISIGEYAFLDCSGLTSIDIPNSVTSIVNNALSGCSGLTNITVGSENKVYDSRDNCNAIIESATNTLITGCKSTIIPNSVASIGNYAFSGCSGLTSITIPNSVTSIGDYAFQDCSGLTSIDIPNSVTSIRDYTFYGCSSLTSIDIPNSVTSIGDYAFQDCSGLTSITIPTSVTSIGDFAFNACGGLTSITIPNSVTSVGDYAFFYCNSLTSIDIPNSVTSIGSYAFYSCSSLTSITIDSENMVYDSRDNCNAIIESATNTLITGCKNTIIPNSVTSIGGSAFYSCSGLTSITIPNSVTSIGYQAFRNCSSLMSIISYITEPFTIADDVFDSLTKTNATLSVPWDSKEKYLATDGWSQFKTIREIAPENGTIFAVEANGVTLTFKVTDSENYVCQLGSGEQTASSNNAKYVTVPNEVRGLTVTTIGDNAFANCSELLYISFPESIETVGEHVLDGCNSLAVIHWNAAKVMPTSLTKGISNPNLLLYIKQADYAPTDIQNVVVNGEAENIVLKETDGGNNFYCPEAFTAKKVIYEHKYGMTSGYKECRGWETIVLPFNVTSITSETGANVVPREAWSPDNTQQKPFFLYELTSNGWQPAPSIKANTPYIICMPNNENYDPAYQLKGTFEFRGTNVQILSSDELTTVTCNNKQFEPNFQNQAASQSILALNVKNQWSEITADYAEGSVFIRGLRQVRPFEAYMTVEGAAAPEIIPVFEDGMATSIQTISLRNVHIHNADDSWYSLDGCKLQCKPTVKGIYTVNRRKVVVK